MLDPFLSHELAVGRDLRGQRVVLVRVERDIFHRRRLLSRLTTAECLPRTRYPRRARRRSAYIPSTGFEPCFSHDHVFASSFRRFSVSGASRVDATKTRTEDFRETSRLLSSLDRWPAITEIEQPDLRS